MPSSSAAMDPATVDGDLNMHPSGEWGISFWVNSDTQKIANQGGNLTNIQNHRLIPSKIRIRVHFLNINKYPVCSPANEIPDCPVLQTDDP